MKKKLFDSKILYIFFILYLRKHIQIILGDFLQQSGSRRELIFLKSWIEIETWIYFHLNLYLCSLHFVFNDLNL